jgi:dipeptidyl aminopeptidase/acylaminoacyl peptidase
MKWAAWSVGYSTEQQDRMRASNQPVQNKLALFNLATSVKTSLDNVQSFSFSGDGKFLLMRRYPPQATGGAAPAAAPGRAGGAGRGGGPAGPALDDAPASGGTITIRNLATNAEVTFGNVGEEAWSEGGALLAMTISATDQAGNGVHVYDAATGALRVLDSATAGYLGLLWRAGSTDLVVMKGKADDKKDGLNYQILAWTGVGTSAEKKLTYDPTADGKFPAGQRLVTFRRPSWSDDGKLVQLGFAPWKDKVTPAGRGSTGATGSLGTDPGPADVAVWHWKDADVMSRQKLSAGQDQRRNLLGIWHVDTGAFTAIGKDFQETIQPIRRTHLALVTEWGKYAMARSIGRGAGDLLLADLDTGARTPLKANVGGNAQVSTNGKYVLFTEKDHWWTINLATKAVTNLTLKVPTVFVNKDSDQTTAQKPMFGAGGWLKDDAGVLLYDKYDIWQVTPDGSSAKKLTNGAADMVTHRMASVEAAPDGVDLAKTQYLSLFGTRTKKSGYARLSAGNVERLVFDDKAIGGLGKARDADVYIHTAQRYDDSPDMFVSGADLKGARQVTKSNPFLADYAWGKSETIDYTTDKWHGLQKLQGTLYYPANYEPGKQYPMIVYMYELLSDNVHRFVAPTDRDYYNTSVWTTQGYFVLQPDITFKPRDPGLSVVSCVTAAIKAATAKGMIDPKKVGVIGHSWGGFDAAFLATHTNGVITTAVAGAAITDLVSNYGNGHWSSGILETDHIETGQQRMEVPIYEDLQAYIRNSAIFNAHNMTMPLLIEVGNVDGTVWWHQGIELYSIGRRAGKNVVMIEYNAEDHGLSQYKDQKDYQQRILQWFGHYLKGDPAPSWITDGQSWLDRQDEVRKLSTPAAGAGRGGRGGGQ